MNGCTRLNWPPNGAEALLWNQALALSARDTMTSVVVPLLALKRKVPCATSRVVEYPIIVSVTPDPFRATVTLLILGAKRSTRKDRCGAGLGVISVPFATILTVNVIVPATVPVWRAAIGPANVTLVELAGMLKFRVRPPVAN